ncbi:MAG TPA: hypothetical protein VMW80_11525 [Candidatus Dormibacteraeota bacterium]|nr:hypothetical protein [Candidatus Dormibacteraeota bacterium]
MKASDIRSEYVDEGVLPGRAYPELADVGRVGRRVMRLGLT